jgi:hypothetical protein
MAENNSTEGEATCGDPAGDVDEAREEGGEAEEVPTPGATEMSRQPAATNAAGRNPEFQATNCAKKKL